MAKTRTPVLLKSIDMPAVPWTEASLDFLTGLLTLDWKSTILVVVCHFSKMLMLIPLGEMTDAESVVAAFFTHVVRVHGLAKQLLSDHDPRLVGEVWTKLM